MEGLKRTFILISREFTEFYSSKSWIIVLILPLFITFLFATVYHQVEPEKYQIAYTPALQPAMVELLQKSRLQPVKYENLRQAKNALAQNKVDAVLFAKSNRPNRFVLQVTQSGYKKSAAISNALNVVLIQIHANPQIPQLEVEGPPQKTPLDWVALPLWLIQIILTICLLQNTALIADEKERQTLHALLVSPMTPTDYLAAKLAWSTILGTGSLLLTLLLTRSPAQPGYILAFGLLGALVYSGLAVCIGLLAPNALFARSTATALYLFSSLPLMVSNVDLAWKGLLHVFPTFLILRGFEAALIPAARGEVLAMALGLLAEAIALFALTRLALQHKVDF
ncbi:MAG TPA: ABC transporter permease [Bacillota bacterium]|nr:ABC transporter permease [Bacillota bacterium]